MASPLSPSSPTHGALILAQRYRILRKLGSGSTGTVYLTKDLVTQNEVALKIIRSEVIDAHGIEALKGEFLALVGLSHPHLAAAHDFGYTERGRVPFYTREFIEGVPLAPGPPLSMDPRGLSRHLQPILDVSDGLEFLHSRGIYHRDLHAGNVLTNEDSRRGAVLIDVGMAPPAPESIARDPAALASVSVSSSRDADLVALGQLLRYRLTGRADGGARLKVDAAGPSQRLIVTLERILEKAFHVDPGERFSTAREFRRALEGALNILPGSATPSGDAPIALIGRQTELVRIDDLLKSIAGGGTGLRWLVGEVGSGKTRLLSEARWRAQIQGFSIVEVQFLPAPGASSKVVDRLQVALGSRGVDACLQTLSPDHGGTSRERARRMAASFDAIPERPHTLVLLDDFECADRESRTVAETLIELATKKQRSSGKGWGLIIATERPPARRLCDPASTIYLKSLARHDVLTMLGEIVHPLDIPSALLRKLADVLGGNPWRLEGAARALRREWESTDKLPADVHGH